MSFSEHLDLQYHLGFEEGKAGKGYSGRTHYGYYGWLDGHEIWIQNQRREHEYH